MQIIKQISQKAKNLIRSKQQSELAFWKNEIANYQKWFDKKLSPHYLTQNPEDYERVKAPNNKDASILTWHKLHQEVKYLEDLDLHQDAFQGMKLLDVGSGPMPSATCFKGCRLYCLDPLLPKYIETGFPVHYYENVNFIHGASEKIPVENDFFDAVISVNAIDHVDDIRKTAAEIRRVLKTDGLLRIHVHYHSPTKCEPNNVDDDLFEDLFCWCKNFKKIKASNKNHSTSLPGNESFVLWSNF